MEESLRVFVSLFVAVFLFLATQSNYVTIQNSMKERPASSVVTKGNTSYYTKRTITKEGNTFIFEDVMDENSDIVVDFDSGKILNTYNYQQVLLSFALQGKMMPCRYLVFNTKYITQETARKVSFKNIVSQLRLDMTQTQLDAARFVLIKEGNDMTWYLVDVKNNQDISQAGGTYGRNLTYIRRNPNWDERINYSSTTYVHKYQFTEDPSIFYVRDKED